MAEAIMQDLIDQAGLEDQIQVDSAGIISYHSGEMADARARQILADNGIDYLGEARKISDADFEADYLIGMTQDHIDELGWAKPKSVHPKIHLLLDFVEGIDESEIPDPYYSGDFGYVYGLIEAGCKGLLKEIVKEYRLGI